MTFLVIASGDNWPDAICAGAFAARPDINAGVPLLSFQQRVTQVTLDRVKQRNPTDIIVVGGTSAVPDSVITSLKTVAPNAKYTRIVGVDREDTAVKLDAYGQTTPPPAGITLNPGDNWQSKIDANPGPVTFLVKGVHLMTQVFTPKAGQTYISDGTAVLDGKKTLTKVLNATADGVTLSGLEIRYYKSPLQHGAIDGDWGGGKNWTLEDIDAHHMFSAGVGIGNGWKMIRGKVHDCGQIGLKASSSKGALFDGTATYHNHYDPGVPEWNWDGATQGGNLAETGGCKFSQTQDLVCRNMKAYDNDGPGLWTDIDNIRTLYELCEVYGNVGAGIFHEISYDAVIRRNHVYNNGKPAGWVWNAAIQIAASGGVGAGIIDIYENLIENCQNNIALMQQRRQENSGATTVQPHTVRNVKVHDNTTKGGANAGSTAISQDYIDATFPNIQDPARGNDFQNNHYEGPFKFPGPFSKVGQDGLSWANWQALGYDKAGTYK